MGNSAALPSRRKGAEASPLPAAATEDVVVPPEPRVGGGWAFEGLHGRHLFAQAAAKALGAAVFRERPPSSVATLRRPFAAVRLLIEQPSPP